VHLRLPPLRRVVSCVCVGGFLAIASGGSAQDTWTHPMLTHGKQPHHGYFNAQ
jgi:hypothetical protein